MGKRFAPQQSDSLNTLFVRGLLDLANYFRHGRRCSSLEGQHFRVAATRTAQGATLEPQGKAHSWPLGLRYGYDLGNLEKNLFVTGTEHGGLRKRVDGLPDYTASRDITRFAPRPPVLPRPRRRWTDRETCR